MSYFHVQSPRQQKPRPEHAPSEFYQGPIATTVDHQLVLRFAAARQNVLPRLSRSLDKLLLQNSTNSKQTNVDDTFDIFSALGLEEKNTTNHSNSNSNSPTAASTAATTNTTHATHATHTTTANRSKNQRKRKKINHGESKNDLQRGHGIFAQGPGGSKIRLDQYGGQLRRRRHHITELRGHMLGEILATTQDRSKFLVLRDFQLPEIIARWQKYFLRAVVRTWRNIVVLAKEDMLRYRKMFIKSDREIMKRALKILRHEAELAMAQRANHELNNHSREDEEKNQMIRDLKSKSKVARAKIISLELQNDSLLEERSELRIEIAKWMELAKGKGVESVGVATTPGAVVGEQSTLSVV